MSSKANPYPSRGPSPRREPSSSRQNGEVHHSPYVSRGFMGDLIMGPKKLPEYTKPEIKKAPVKGSGIFDEKGRVPSKIFEKEVEKYDSHIGLSRKIREKMAEDIIDDHITTEIKDVKDYLQDVKEDHPNPDVDEKIQMREMKKLLDKKMGKK